MKEKLDPNGRGFLIPEENVRCGNSKEGDWAPCGAHNTTVEDKKVCNWYECPYHEFEFE